MPMKIGNSAFLLQAKDRGRRACADAVLMTSPYFVFNSACILSGTGVATYLELGWGSGKDQLCNVTDDAMTGASKLKIMAPRVVLAVLSQILPGDTAGAEATQIYMKAIGRFVPQAIRALTTCLQTRGFLDRQHLPLFPQLCGFCFRTGTLAGPG